MDHELDLLLGTVIDSLAKLMILFHLLDRDAAVLTPEAIATGVGRQPEPVARALAELAEAGLVKQFQVGRGRNVLYRGGEDAHVRSLVAQLRTRWEESAESRAEVMRKVLRGTPGGEASPGPTA